MKTNTKDATILIREDHRLEMIKIKEAFEANPAFYKAKLRKHEEIFGKDFETRTKKQWQRLVRVYGVDQIARIENKSIDEIKDKYESLKDQLARKQRNRLRKV